MTKRCTCVAVLAMLLAILAAPAFAHGDRVIAHVVNGLIDSQGQRYRTKIDITNLGPDPSTPINKLTVYFKHRDGTEWFVGTDQGTVSQIALTMGASQTIRISTSGSGTYEDGYAVVRNLGPTTIYAEDYDVSISVFYDVMNTSGNVIETVTVPVSQPTVSWSFPVENDSTKGIGTGFVVVDLSSAPAGNLVSLKLMQANPTPSGNAIDGGSKDIPLSANAKLVRMLTEADIFPGATNLRGTLVGQSTGPVAILGLLITPVPGGFQYATMAPAYIDGLRRDSMAYLPQGFALDADLNIVDYFHSQTDPIDPALETPWDVLFETDNSDTTGARRHLLPQQGALLAVIGDKTGTDFDAITQEALRPLVYSSNIIDLSDATGNNLHPDFCFAIKTGLGRYAKVRIRDIVDFPSSAYKALILELFTYK